MNRCRHLLTVSFWEFSAISEDEAMFDPSFTLDSLFRRILCVCVGSGLVSEEFWRQGDLIGSFLLKKFFFENSRINSFVPKDWE